jgi:tRNA (cytidine/uridine-2'-O-)-methyltransferase
MVQLVLYQPDIAQNLGALLRLAACTGLALHVIEPCGFPLDDARMRRAGMDYIDQADWTRHTSWDAFEQWRAQQSARLLVMTTKASTPYTQHAFAARDCVLFGQESAGLPDPIHALADARLTIPMREGARSLNLALSAAMLAGEALRQESLR